MGTQWDTSATWDSILPTPTSTSMTRDQMLRPKTGSARWGLQQAWSPSVLDLMSLELILWISQQMVWWEQTWRKYQSKYQSTRVYQSLAWILAYFERPTQNQAMLADHHRLGCLLSGPGLVSYWSERDWKHMAEGFLNGFPKSPEVY